MKALFTLLMLASASGPAVEWVPAYSPEAEAQREAVAFKKEGDRLQEAERPVEAREAWNKALEAYERSGFRLGQVEVLFRIGATYQVEAAFDPQKQELWINTMMRGFVKALEQVRDSLPREEPANREAVEKGDALFAEASALAAAGDCQSAAPRFSQAGEVYSGAGWAFGEAASLAERLRCPQKGSNPLALMLAMGEVNQLIAKLKPKMQTAPRISYLLAIDNEGSRDLKEAETQYRKASAASGEDAGIAALAMIDLGVLLARREDLEEARTLFTSARERFVLLSGEEARRNEAAAARNLEGLDRIAAGLAVAREEGKETKAEASAEKKGAGTEQASPRPQAVESGVGAIVPLNEKAQARGEAAFALGEGDRLIQEGRLGEAREKWRSAAEGFRQAGHPRGSWEAYRRLGDSYAPEAMSDPRKMLLVADYMSSALEAAAEVEESESSSRGEAAEKGRALLKEASDLVAVGDCDGALPLIEEAGEVMRHAGLPVAALRGAALKARCAVQRGNVEEAFFTMLQTVPSLGSLPEGSSIQDTVWNAEVLLLAGRVREARDLYREALRRYEEAGDLEGRMDALLALGGIDLSLDEFREAETSLRQGLDLLPGLVGRREFRFQEAAARHNLGSVYAATSRGDEGVAELRAALALWQELGEPMREVASLSALGVALRAQGDYPGALAVLEEAEALLSRLSPNPELAGDLHTNRAVTYYSQGRFREATASYERALELFRRLPVRTKEAQALSNLGAVEKDLGNFSKALDLFRQSQAMARQAGAVSLEAKAGTNEAMALAESGEPQAAVQAYLRLLPFIQATGELWWEATARSNLGGILLGIGDLSRAGAHLGAAIETFEKIGSADGQAAALLNRGHLREQLGHFKEGENDYRKALEILTELGDTARALKVRFNLALAARRGGKPEEELPFLEQGLAESRQAGLSRDALRFSFLIGDVHFRRGDLEAACQQAAGVVAEAQRTGDTVVEILGRSLILQCLVRQGDFVRASGELEPVVALIEKWRGDVSESGLKGHFFSKIFSFYALGVLIEIQRGRPEEAFRFAEEARARAFLDQLGSQKLASWKGTDAELVRQEGELRAQISRLSETMRKETEQRPQRGDLIKGLKGALEVARKDYEALLLRLRLANPEYTSLVGAEMLSLAEVQRQVLDEETTLIEYFVPSAPSGEKSDLSVVAWVIERDRFSLVELPISADALKGKVDPFRESIGTRGAVESQAAELYRALFAPLAPHVRHSRLVIVPHGVLHFLPFAALWDEAEKRHLGEAYALSYAPSATALRFALEKKPGMAGPALVAGNPDGSLPEAAREARAVARVHGTEPLLGLAAGEGIIASRASGAGMIHLAAHADLGSGNPLFSAVKLAPDAGHDGRLEVHEVYGLDLSKTGLVVLSGCQTQLGERSQGDEITGLTRAFLYAGTPAVMSSLWRVDDESAAFFMERFHGHLRKGEGRAAALQKAQAETRGRFPHPRDWAAFVLTGEGDSNLHSVQGVR